MNEIPKELEYFGQKLEVLEESIREVLWREIGKLRKELIGINMRVEDLVAENVRLNKELYEAEIEKKEPIELRPA